jgi:hypothetical protein
VAREHARQGAQCEDWQHERTKAKPLACVPGRQSQLSDVHVKRMLQERLTQWKTGSTGAGAAHSLLKQQTAARRFKLPKWDTYDWSLAMGIGRR